MIIRTSAACVIAGLALTACGDREDSAPVAVWRVDSIPAVSIGVEAGEPPYELDRAYDARRLPDGGIAVANSGTHEIRVFDREGGFLRAAGRRGEGPGEFSGTIRFVGGADDSLLVFDQSTQRVTTLAPDGAYRGSAVVEEDAPLRHAAAWVHGATLILDGADRERVASVIDRLPEPGAVRVGRLDGTGRLWLRLLREPGSTWEIVGLEGTWQGTIALPANLDPLQVGPDFVLGRMLDSLGVERIQLYAVHPPNAPPQALPPSTVPPAMTGGTDVLGRLVLELMGAQEMHYMNHARYASVADSLPWPGGADVVLLTGDARGWLGMLVDGGGRAACAIAVGYTAPPFWTEGSAVCGG